MSAIHCQVSRVGGSILSGTHLDLLPTRSCATTIQIGLVNYCSGFTHHLPSKAHDSGTHQKLSLWHRF